MDCDDYIIDSKNLRFEPYVQPRGDGFSGQLLLATQINNPHKKYIIKAGVAHVAACDFMFYRLATKINLPVARVRIVNPIKPNEFKYPACAVEFIPNAVKLLYKEFMEIEDCVKLSYLSYILGDRDNLDFLRDVSGVLYLLNTAENHAAMHAIYSRYPTSITLRLQVSVCDVRCFVPAETNLLFVPIERPSGRSDSSWV